VRDGRLSARDARRLAISAQGLGRARPGGTTGTRHLRDAIRAVGVLQLDAINVVARTQFLVLFSRIGAYDTRLLLDMTGPGGELFECAGYRAALMPVAHQPLLRWRADRYATYRDSPTSAARWDTYLEVHADYIAGALGEVAERGPLTASQLSDPRRRDGDWWERRSDGRRALEVLFAKGELAAWRTPTFERVYDLAERVIPPSVLAQPTPTEEEAQRALVMLAARSMGVATVADLAGYHLLQPATARARVAELVEAGELVRVEVEQWTEPAYLPVGARPAPLRRAHATLLSPFDPLISNRRRTRRMFGFDYRIEVYVPEAKRQYGYYVLPMLLDDRLVGRFDLKADRKTSTLRVAGAYLEPDVTAGPVLEAAAAELGELAAWLELEDITVATRGNLARPLQHAVRP
jgi:uncharacterized protein